MNSFWQSPKTTIAGLSPAIVVAYRCYVEKRPPTPEELEIMLGFFTLGAVSKDYDTTHAR